MPPGFSMVGGIGPLCIAGQAGLGPNGPWAYGQAGLEPNGPWAYGVVGLKTTLFAMILSSKPRVWKAGKVGKLMRT